MEWPSALSCSKTLRSVLQLLVTANVFLVRRLLHTEDGDDTFLRNVGSYKTHTAPHTRRRHFSLVTAIRTSIIKSEIFLQRIPNTNI
jgi:hypothetical protein